MAKGDKGPRSEHPRLVGFSEVENALIERAAKRVQVAGNAYIREAALWDAREELGLPHPPEAG